MNKNQKNAVLLSLDDTVRKNIRAFGTIDRSEIIRKGLLKYHSTYYDMVCVFEGTYPILNLMKTNSQVIAQDQNEILYKAPGYGLFLVDNVRQLVFVEIQKVDNVIKRLITELNANLI